MKQSSAARTTRTPKLSPAEAVYELENGSSMDQKTFHALYEQTPEGFKAELIGGTVYVMSSPVSPRHGRPHARIVYWLCCYADETPGIDAMDNTTSIMGEESEPQPDACLLILPESGGRATIMEDKYISGPIDLIVEVSNTSRAIDLGKKKQDYETAGVREYVVVLVKDQSVRWFHRTDGRFAELAAGADGLFRSEAFPGLWLDPKGLFSLTSRPLSAAVRQGLATPEHAAFVAELEGRRAAKPKKPAKKSRRKTK